MNFLATPRRRRLLLLAAAAAGLVAAALLAWRTYLAKPTPHQPDDPFPLPPYSESAFLNVGPEARYVGSAVCAGCHPKNHASYLRTAHSRALSDLDPRAEPPDGSFEHEASGRSYRVYRKDGQFRHEEVLRTSKGKEVARVDLPVRYLIGSGHFTRTYLVEVDGFLHESPITWYASKRKWDVSPGYDFPVHHTFERPVGLDCLGCHAGRAEAVGDTFHRIAFQQKAIGCENCHGPGSLHEQRHRAGKRPAGEDDPTIVHPGKLSRELQEAICAACHVGGPATVTVRGRTENEFRPGRPLTDYRIAYRFADNEQMTVVGHVEQLHQSACYKKSGDLTCLTCHAPHQREAPKDREAFYRQKCLNCHDDKPCRLDRAERLKKQPKDDCAACHMPRGDTDVPHVAFTHHRIGLHGRTAGTPSGVPRLVPTYDDSRLSPLDRRRNLGLAYLQASVNPAHRPYAEAFAERARQLLDEVEEAGLRDLGTLLGLAQTHLQSDPGRGRAYAHEALDVGGASGKARLVALKILAYAHLRDGYYPSAAELLEQVVLLHRNSDDWRLLGGAYLKMDQPARALPALQKAVEIRPFRHSTHASLADAYRRLGDARRAEEHQDKARWLLEHRQD
jgi:tetratricopeptide (TPR) repeat protein